MAVVAVLMFFGDWQLLVLSEFFLMIFERIPELFSQ
jgi:flagellar biosynthesis protein FliQ